ncbi:hypothetical protein [Endothiovibrio diazotrophicus]
MRRLLPVVVASLLFGGCTSLPFLGGFGGGMEGESMVTMESLSPVDRDLIGHWKVVAQFGNAGEDGDMDMIGKTVRLQEQMATDLPGRRCSSATLGLSELMLPDGGRYGAAARGLLAPEGPRPLLVVRCGSRPFGEYLIRPDGTLLARHGEGYLLLAREGESMSSTGASMTGEAPRKPQPPVALHLSSEISPEAAKMEWRSLTRKYSMLKALEPRYQSLDIPGKGHFVRVYGVGEGGKARWICKQLKKKGQYCAVMRVPK